MASPLYEFLAGVIENRPERWWVYCPGCGTYTVNQSMRQDLHLHNRNYFFEECRAWVVDYDALVKGLERQLQHGLWMGLEVTVRNRAETERWRVQGRWVTCDDLEMNVCTPRCRTPHCRVVVGRSGPIRPSPPSSFHG